MAKQDKINLISQSALNLGLLGSLTQIRIYPSNRMCLIIDTLTRSIKIILNNG